ncbi:MAG: ATP-binding protein [Thermoprotei archaeon]|nr:ATP-binding protein [Thermoprotei archaeon]
MGELETRVREEAAGVSERVARLLEGAYSKALKYGDVIGRVSRYSSVKVDERGVIEFEVEPEIYYSSSGKAIHRVGEYVAVVEPKTGKLILLRIMSIERRDELAVLGLEPPVSGYESRPEPAGLLTTTRIKARALLELDPEKSEEPVPATLSIEPQSPVIDPKPGVLARLLDLKDDPGPVIGSLATPSGLVKEGALTVKLPYSILLNHTLIIGTTGSGKTTLLKNMIASIYSTWEQNAPIVIAVDMNQDFIQLPLNPESRPGDPIAENAYRNVKPPESLIVVTPLPFRVINEIIDKIGTGNANSLRIAEEAAKIYYRDSIEPLLGSRIGGIGVKCLRREGFTVMCKIDAPWGPLTFIPYNINTMTMSSDKVSALAPGLTEFARELLDRVRKSFFRDSNLYPPLHVIVGALRAHTHRVSKYDKHENIFTIVKEIAIPRIASGGSNDASLRTFIIEGLNMSLESAITICLETLKTAEPHEETVKSLYRRLLSLLDSEIADVMVAGIGKLHVFEEPRWEDIIVEAEKTRAPVVLDLKWPIDKGLGSLEGPRMAAYRMLQALIDWKHSQWSRRVLGRSVLVVIDEAHQFFPQERGAREEQEASRQVASMISRIARLGRARGVGLIFSTHSPKDLHDIILQLANTKIFLRTEPHHAEKLDIPGEVKEFLPRLPDRLMAVISYAFRGGYVFAQTTTPLTAHYDISYQMFKKR